MALGLSTFNAELMDLLVTIDLAYTNCLAVD